jgi:hypothetical protein
MESGVIAPPFLKSTIYRGEWSVSRPGHFTPAKERPVYIGEGAGLALEPVEIMWRREKSFPFARNPAPAIQTVARHYTDWIIPACYLNMHLYLQNINITLCLKATTQFRGKYSGFALPLYSYMNLNSFNLPSSLLWRKFLYTQWTLVGEEAPISPPLVVHFTAWHIMPPPIEMNSLNASR